MSVMTSPLVFPQQLELRHGEKVGACPDLDEEELSEGENSPALPDWGAGGVWSCGCLDIFDSFVECVC